VTLKELRVALERYPPFISRGTIPEGKYRTLVVEQKVKPVTQN
jgi:hypothetical protein